MKVGGGLNYVVGPMGAGKSLYGVRRIVEAVTSGRYVVTNIRLHDDAFERIAKHITRFTTFGAGSAKLVPRLQRFYVFEEDLPAAMRYRLRGHGEARGVFIWDEGHNDLNNRNWKERRDKFSTDRGTDSILEWATQLRKLGFLGYLLSQHADNTDVALRRVCNFTIRLQNQREQTRALGMRVTPWPLFLAAWYPAHLAFTGTKLQPVKVERYFLDWHRKLYDTWGLYHGLTHDDEDNVIWLGDRHADPAAVRRPAPTPANAGGLDAAAVSALPLPRNAQRAPLSTTPAADDSRPIGTVGGRFRSE